MEILLAIVSTFIIGIIIALAILFDYINTTFDTFSNDIKQLTNKIQYNDQTYRNMFKKKKGW